MRVDGTKEVIAWEVAAVSGEDERVSAVMVVRPSVHGDESGEEHGACALGSTSVSVCIKEGAADSQLQP